MNEKHLALLLKDVEAWNKWRVENPEAQPDLREAHLNEAYLFRVDFHGTFLSRANLSGAFLSEANLSGTNLEGAFLSQATWTDGRKCREGSLGRPVFKEENKNKNA